MTKQKGFTQEFEDEAVRLAWTSGRTPRELAENLGVGLSTLTRWIGRNRDRKIDAPWRARSENMTAELKRLRQENEIPGREHDILKKATAFFAGEGSRWRSSLSIRRKTSSVAGIVHAMAARGIAGDERVVGVSQGYKLTGTIKDVEGKLADGILTRPGSPKMAWCTGNAKVESKGNVIVVT
jgi:transposase